MTTTINASTSNGLVQTADGSGILKVQSNGVTTNALAWIRFAGAASPTVASSYNVTSLTRNGAGDYTVNFTTALSDANYCAVPFTSAASNAVYGKFANIVGTTAGSTAPTTSAIRITSGYTSGTFDEAYMGVVVFGN